MFVCLHELHIWMGLVLHILFMASFAFCPFAACSISFVVALRP